MRNFAMVKELSLCWGFVLLCDPGVPFVPVDLLPPVYRSILGHWRLGRGRFHGHHDDPAVFADLDPCNAEPCRLRRLDQGRGVALAERGWTAGHQWFAFGSVHAFSSGPLRVAVCCRYMMTGCR